MEETRLAIRNFLGKHFQNARLGDEDDIFALGFVNSLFAMQLVMFLEKEFGITIDDEDLDIDNFRSISSIASFITDKKRSR